MHVILGGLKSGGLMTGGLMSCGLMSGGLKSYDHLPHITLEWALTDQTESGNNSQWRIVGSRGPGARNSVGPSAMVRPNVCQLEALEAPRWGPRQSPGGKHILATI